ncbi:MAG: phosphate ABC transporter permease PstA [Actinomycetes bacterium]
MITRGRRLPRWTPYAVAGGSLAVAEVTEKTTVVSGRSGVVLVAVATYLVASTAISAGVEGRRRCIDRLAGTLLGAALLMALIPLVLVLGYTVAQGMHRFDATFLLHSMRNVAEQQPGGGAYQAILGTIEQVGIAAALAVPIGLGVAVYLAEYGHAARLGRAVGLVVDVMTGLPSIVAGLFIYAFWILLLGFSFSGFAGSLALAVLMLPTVVRSTEEIIRLVPHGLREASLALGVPVWRTILKVVLPTALTGIVTGVMLGIARVIGETAPLLLTVFGNPSINADPFSGAQSGLPLFIFNEAQQPYPAAIDRAWAAALALVLIILGLNVAARLLARVASTVNRR